MAQKLGDRSLPDVMFVASMNDRLLRRTNRKSHTCFRLLPKSM